MLVNHTPVTYVAVIAAKYILGYVGLICFTYFLLALFIGGVPAISLPFSIFVEAYGAIEILWYFLWYLPFKSYLQRSGLRMTPLTRAQRKALIEELLDQVPDVRLFMRKWFNQAHLDEIYREDVCDWLIWALWGTGSDEGIEDDELDEYIALAEAKAEYTLMKGRAGAKPIRLNLDPVRMIHRSLLWYGMIGLADHFGTLILMIRGFSFYRQPRSSFFRVFPFRLMTLFAFKESASPHFSYMFRPHKSKKHRPIVFFHGIGIGLPTYSYWLQTIPKDIGVIALEILPVSGRICPEAVSVREYTNAMRQILAQQNIDDFVVMGHSYGTFLVRPLLDDPVIKPQIDSVVLCDPVAILLHLPDVAYNVTRRKPETAPQIEIAWGAAEDPRTAHTLCRRFHWPEHILFREHLVGKHTTVIVASRDCVINPDAVAGYVYYGDAGYITSADLEELKKTPELWTGRAELELIYQYDLDHGQSLLIPSEAKRITDVVETYARNDQYDQPDSHGPAVPEKDPAAAYETAPGAESTYNSPRSSKMSDSNMV
jgi:pimeloyl-ACP methyl ester carboxylesterase